LICAIIAVLGLGAWLLLGQNPTSPQADVSAEPTAEPPDDPAAALGSFFMPGEFDPQEILYLNGPQLDRQYPDVLSSIVGAVEEEIQLVFITSGDPWLPTVGGAEIQIARLPLPEVSLWVRDFGPMTVTDTLGRRSMVQFELGHRRGARTDEPVPEFLASQLGLALLSNSLQIDGGDVLTNGRGFGVLSHRVIDGNPEFQEMGAGGIVKTVASMLGFEKAMLVPPLVGEPTGHADMLMTFLEPGLAVVGRLDPAADEENAELLDKIAEDLETMPTLAGPLRVERIPQPDHLDGVWRTYTGVVFVNGVVLVPTYPDYCPELDTRALDFYRQHLPERKIVPIDCSELVRNGTSLRSITLTVAE
jgi:agmatine/peptidylarginine deiminase